jgi:hypothetical protein
MKFFKLSAVLMMLAILTVFSTKTNSQTISMGIESGLNIANMSLTPNLNSSTKTGFMVGGFADIGVSRIVTIRPGLRYISKGFTLTGNGLTLNEKMSYLEMPLLIKASIPLNHVKPYFAAGPTLGINLSASQEISAQGQVVQTDDVSTSWETIDFGLYFGSGFDFHVYDNIDVTTGFGYTLGLTNVSKAQGLEGKNNGIQITTGIKFGL